jgi:hypothetical protein
VEKNVGIMLSSPRQVQSKRLAHKCREPGKCDAHLLEVQANLVQVCSWNNMALSADTQERNFLFSGSYPSRHCSDCLSHAIGKAKELFSPAFAPQGGGNPLHNSNVAVMALRVRHYPFAAFRATSHICLESNRRSGGLWRQRQRNARMKKL